MQHDKIEGSLKGILVLKTMELTQILFMDYVILMGEGTLENIHSIEHILLLYSKAIGMAINFDKSNLALNKVPEVLQQRLRTKLRILSARLVKASST